jgi:hypothetical protein
MGVLAYDWVPEQGRAGTTRIVEWLTDEVRSVELRDDPSALGGAYFRYWLRTMEGRWVPGEDLSFDWVRDCRDADDLAARVRAAARPALLYFFAAGDAGSEEGRALQNETFFDPRVRAAGARVLPVIVDRAKAEEWFASYGLARTPAVAVVGTDGKVRAALAGRVKAGVLAKALESAR